MAPQKEFESPTFRLGGGRSILLSYGRICHAIVTEKWGYVNKMTGIFLISSLQGEEYGL